MGEVKHLLSFYICSEEDLGAGTWAYSRTFLHHTDVVTSIAVFNEHFATSGYDLSVCIWNINADDEPVHVIRLKNEYATSINWSPDGNYLAIATGNLTSYFYLLIIIITMYV
jgi:WD40 repeat protein